jgi:hypothetical protein
MRTISYSTSGSASGAIVMTFVSKQASRRATVRDLHRIVMSPPQLSRFTL